MTTPDHLCCRLCSDMFTKPKYLPCFHVFCESCLSTHITSEFKKGDGKSMECPVCQRYLETPKENCQPNEWAEMFPLHFQIYESIEKLKPPSVPSSFAVQDLKNVETVDTLYEINRYKTLGEGIYCWPVDNTKPEAVSIVATKAVSLCGFLSFGCKDGSPVLDVEVKVIKAGDILADLKTSLINKEYKDRVTKLYLQTPIDIYPYVRYDVVFTFSNKCLCHYGANGKNEVTCEGIGFQFYHSQEGARSNVYEGHIPGLLFKKYKE